MKRLMQWVMAAALICSASVFSSCSKDDNPVDPADKLSEKIIGKWISTEMDGRPLMTNSKAVFTFVSATKVYMSASINKNPGSEFWGDQLEGDVVIDGNKITITNKTGEQMTTAIEFIVTAINKYEFFAKRKMTVMVYDKVVFSLDDTVRYAKVNVDYSEAILGTWEGKVTSSEGSEFDDGETHRWEYKADGTYVYYEKDGDDWLVSNLSSDDFGALFDYRSYSLPVTNLAGDYVGSYDLTDIMNESLVGSTGVDMDLQGTVAMEFNLSLADDGTFVFSYDAAALYSSLMDYLNSNLDAIFMTAFGVSSVEELETYSELLGYDSYDEMKTDLGDQIAESISAEDLESVDITGTYTVEGNEITLIADDPEDGTIPTSGTIEDGNIVIEIEVNDNDIIEEDSIDLVFVPVA